MRPVLLLLLLVMAGAGCTTIQENAQELRDKITNVDIDDVLGELKDCDALSERFVDVVGSTADLVDGLAQTTDGRIPETDIRRYVDTIAVSKYYDIAERIGCAEIQQRVRTVEMLKNLAPDTPEGQEFLEQIREQVEQGI